MRIRLRIDEWNRVQRLAEKERRVPQDQAAHMLGLIVEIFDALPEYMDREEQSEVLLTLLRDAVTSQDGQAFVALQETVRRQQERMDKAAEMLVV